MAVITKVDVSLDLRQPAQEVCDVITLVLSMHPGREIDILRHIDEEVGMALAQLEKAQEQQADQSDQAATDKD
ncbi:hypothetical protein KB559_11030 [Paenibacillus sp. Marseille-P2973]|uniref:hypothetical protein n=1 Tax=Paenibacillus sp. Marseille-P2973 TaxID=1871032 RepID=UPI001B35DDA1|nr:hypothetical protein [Paenibacillus sp. Marseille-P2973]MBQ4899370.1 hypothetical protein [Paenibacillus sp. Marseille-P2973]